MRLLQQSAAAMARLVRAGSISSAELVNSHVDRVRQVNPALNAVVETLFDSAIVQARAADAKRAAGEPLGAFHGVPFTIKDSIESAGSVCTAGTLGRRNAPPAARDATVVARLRSAGAIPIARTNLPDLLFAFETDNLIYGRTDNPYDPSRTPGGSSGGEAAIIAACGSPLGLGSDCAGSVRLPAHFCGIAAIKPTSGRLPRTGHVPPAGGWIEPLWQIGPMARYVEDIALAMRLLAGPDGEDFTALPVPLGEPLLAESSRGAFFTYNGLARCIPEIEEMVQCCAHALSGRGVHMEQSVPPGLDQCYELELALLGADGAKGLDEYLESAGSVKTHPLLTDGFVSRMRPFATSAAGLAKYWDRWHNYRGYIGRFFERYDFVLCPVYTQPALPHLSSVLPGNFEGFSYTMAWNLAGAPAATVRCGSVGDLPLNVQVVAKPWHDLFALQICGILEEELGGWRPAEREFRASSAFSS